MLDPPALPLNVDLPDPTKLVTADTFSVSIEVENALGLISIVDYQMTDYDYSGQDKYVLGNVAHQSAYGPSHATADKYTCTLQGQSGAGTGGAGTYSCADARTGITVTVAFSGKTIAATCPLTPSGLPNQLVAQGLSGDDTLKISGCS